MDPSPQSLGSAQIAKKAFRPGFVCRSRQYPPFRENLHPRESSQILMNTTCSNCACAATLELSEAVVPNPRETKSSLNLRPRKPPERSVYRTVLHEAFVWLLAGLCFWSSCADVAGSPALVAAVAAQSPCW